MSGFITKLLLISLIFCNVSYALEDTKQSTNTLLEKPLIERYVFDELKALRTNQLKLKEEVTTQITKSELSPSLQEELKNENSFDSLSENKTFLKLLS